MSNLQHQSFFEVIGEILHEEISALANYKVADNGSAYQINAFLRGNRGATPPDATFLEQLNSVIHKSRTVKPIRPFRATFAEDFDQFVRDGVFCDPAYASTSLSDSNLGGHFVNGFSKHPIKLEINCPERASAFYLELAQDKGETESECLLPRCSCYRIDVELPPITEVKAIAKAMGQTNWYHAQGFEDLRIIGLSLLIS